MFVLAEVADKSLVPDHPIVLGTSVALAMLTLGLLIAKMRRWMAVVPAAVALLFPATWIAEIAEPTTGPALIAELGTAYFVRLFAGFFVPYGASVVALLWLSKYVPRLRGADPASCVECDYDLREPSSDRCPECGTVFPPRQA